MPAARPHLPFVAMTMRWAFAASEDSVGQARRLVAEAVSDLPGTIRDAAVLMVSELTTNALVHAPSGFEMTIVRTDASVTVSVTDRGDGTPVVRSPTTAEPHGRGLQIVEVLSDEWGTTAVPPTGKTVWFRILLGRDGIAGRLGATTTTAAQRSGHPSSPVGQGPPPLRPEPRSGRSDQPTACHRTPRRRGPSGAPGQRVPMAASG